jgi:serpin B
MKLKRIFWIILPTIFMVSVGHTNAEESSMIKKIVQNNTAFALDLYQQLQPSKGNLFFSPFSISAALAMTYAGASENTAGQMATVLHFTADPDHLHESMGQLISQLNSVQKETDIELKIANAIWTQKGYPFLDEFIRIVRQSYLAELNQADFVAAEDAARQAINSWVEQQTDQKIKDLIPPKVLNDLTRLVLVNAVYFKGFWESQFKPADTMDLDFWLSADTTVTVPLMHQEHKFGYWENEWLQVLEMPYKDEPLSLVVLLPKEIAGISDLEQKLTTENILTWQNSLRKRKVIVLFPKFKLESEFSLNRILAAMGMADAFDPQRADFSAMVGRKELYISAVLHKAFVEVSEEGTEAAAATGVVVSAMSAGHVPPIFKADHPFVFYIRDNASQSILFLGRLTDPRPH